MDYHIIYYKIKQLFHIYIRNNSQELMYTINILG